MGAGALVRRPSEVLDVPRATLKRPNPDPEDSLQPDGDGLWLVTTSVTLYLTCFVPSDGLVPSRVPAAALSEQLA